MAKGSDRRIQLTKQMLAQELVKAAQNRNIDDISIKEICDNAGVSRVTFYKYYRSIPELMQETAKDAMGYILKDGLETDTLQNVLRYILLNRSLYLVLIDNGYYEKEMSEYLNRQLNDSSDVSAAIVKYAVSGSAGLLKYCLEKQPDIPVKTLAEIIVRFHKAMQEDVKEMGQI